MITSYYKDYLYSIDLDSLDNNQISKELLHTEKYLHQKFPNGDKDNYQTFTTNIFHEYNTFQFPLKETFKLYKKLVNNIYPFLDKNESYWLQCWFNVFRKDENIDWHKHWKSQDKVWHGFYCVYSNNSYTEYKIPNSIKITTVPSKNGRLVFGRSDGDEHRSSPWMNEKNPRITIAFDIIPYSTLKTCYEQMDNRIFIPFS